MDEIRNSNVIFVSTAHSALGKACLRMLIDSLRTFGGEIGKSPFWVFTPSTNIESFNELEQPGVQIFPLQVPEGISHYLFAGKVSSCAQAEATAVGKVRSLVFIDPVCLVVNPPALYDLGEAYDAALRPVHIRNVGLPVTAPLDLFWQGIYRAVGVQDIEMTVQSFVDQQVMRAYFNSHAFAVNPTLGLMQRWLELFQTLVGDKKYQAEACQDEVHQIFLFQASLSVLLVTSINESHIRILPPTYNYPYNLQETLAPERRARALNELVSFTYEDKSIDPAAVKDIEIEEPLRSWLFSRDEIKLSSG